MASSKKNHDGGAVAVASRSFSRHPVLRQELLNLFPGSIFNDTGKVLKGKELADFLRGFQRAIVGLEIIDEGLLSGLPELKVISKYGVGCDGLDLQALRRRGVLLGWTPGVNRRSVSELTLAFMISLLRHIPRSHQDVVGGRWEQIKGSQLSGKTVGIVGCGHIGKDLVRLLQPFQCRIQVCDIREYAEFNREFKIERMGLRELLTSSDIVTLHVPLNDTTRGMIGSAEISLMKPHALLINNARGGLVDEKALKKALIEKKIGGAACDVFFQEPPTDQELLTLPQFLATPHIGGGTEESVLAMGRAAIEGLRSPKPVDEYPELL